MTPLDEHAQPIIGNFNASRRADRAIHEMLGFAKGVLCDGVVAEDEVIGLARWFEANPDAVTSWPADVVYKRIRRVLADGCIEEEECAELSELLRQVTGQDTVKETGLNAATTLPLTQPPPTITFPSRLFVFTGRFYFGTRVACETAVISRGAECCPSLNARVNYLVIGALGSRDWAHTPFGRKIERAVALCAEGKPLAIIGEEHWTKSLATLEGLP